MYSDATCRERTTCPRWELNPGESKKMTMRAHRKRLLKLSCGALVLVVIFKFASDKSVFSMRLLTSMKAVAVGYGRRSALSQEADDSLSTSLCPLGTETRDVYSRRRRRSDDACFASAEGRVYRMVQHADSRTAYCVIPKASCTFWLSVFRWLNEDTYSVSYSNPLSLTRRQVQNRPEKMRVYAFNATNSPAFLENRFRFMFVRDPYSRLWSAYVDKFLLPNFWKMYGWRIVQRRPWNHTADERCARNISFSEFLDYVTSTAPGSLNEHFAPYRLLCSPCVFRPHVIGKMETFGEDARYVLQQLNLSRFASEFSSYDKHARHEMTMLIDDVYLVYEESFFKFCTNTTDLAARLWQVLQINGYLPSDIAFPWNKNKHVNKHALKELVLEVYSRHPNRDEHVQKIQKEQSLVNGYRTVPDDILAKVRELYALEFKMFGYDPFPEKLYGYRNTSMTNLDFPFRE
ncbi:carbohydrate sulfotransferase 13-like isoform X2 [Pomacea canaliculata]|uniref:carbohydrate sulfotransferase 13-like isoform X2 n=1 Tax=Pomacea canaliculata TaxID=400727 RepID=UPI000D72F51C|nr:carbohydrate sulfotransferase 13-like isoform X2 [Pomacea canaliculata]